MMFAFHCLAWSEPSGKNKLDQEKAPNAMMAVFGEQMQKFQAFNQDKENQKKIADYMEKSKKCEPVSLKYPHPMMPGEFGENHIKGRKNGLCRVDMHMPGDMILQCAYTKKCLKKVTDQGIGGSSGKISFSSSDKPDPCEKECTLIRPEDK